MLSTRRLWLLYLVPMNMSYPRLLSVATLAIAALVVVPAACSSERTQARSGSEVSQSSDATKVSGTTAAPTAALTASRAALLTTAFAGVSRMPIDPHERDRARAQESVVQACLELGFLDQAAQLADQMQGWRQGNVIALLGQRYAALGQDDRARACAARALLIDPGESTWGKDIVATEVARIYVKLGDDSKAYATVAADLQAERGRVEAERTAKLPDAQLDAQADMFDKAIATMNFDLARGGIDGYLAWLDRVIDDAPRRERALKALSAALPGLPFDLQVRGNVQLADVLFAHGYKELATLQVDRASELFRATVFLPEDTAPLGVVVAKARIRLGDPKAGRAELRRLRTEYEARAETIVNLRRAASWRALAEGYLLLGDTEDAGYCYAAALDAGALNPNARPRAEDLSATCVSMAVSGFMPPPELLLRIENIRAGLADPW